MSRFLLSIALLLMTTICSYSQYVTKYHQNGYISLISDGYCAVKFRSNGDIKEFNNVELEPHIIRLSKRSDGYYIDSLEGLSSQDRKLLNGQRNDKRIKNLRTSVFSDCGFMMNLRIKELFPLKIEKTLSKIKNKGLMDAIIFNALHVPRVDKEYDKWGNLIKETVFSDVDQSDPIVPITTKTVCSIENLDLCGDEKICTEATTMIDDIMSWNFNKLPFVKEAESRNLQCGIVIDKSPFTNDEAIYLINMLTNYVQDNPQDFGLDFAIEFNKVRPIVDGEWTAEAQTNFQDFLGYLDQYPAFFEYVENIKIEKEEILKQQITDVREQIAQELIVLKEWAKNNILDTRAVDVVRIDNDLKDNLLNLKQLEALKIQSEELMVSTGLESIKANTLSDEIIESLYEPNAIYIFANKSPNAENIYKNLDGLYVFEEDKGIVCISHNVAKLEQYFISNIIFSNFPGLSSYNYSCSGTSDLFVANANELATDKLFDLVQLGDLDQLEILTKESLNNQKEQLEYYSNTIKEDVLMATRVGYGFIEVNTNNNNVCSIIKDQEEGHIFQIKNYKNLLFAIDLEWEDFGSKVKNAEDAFRLTQRDQCKYIYGSSQDLGRLYVAMDKENIRSQFMPLWISQTLIDQSQKDFDNNVKQAMQEEAQYKRNLEDRERLDKEVERRLAESAKQQQEQLRETYNLKFMALKEEMQRLLYLATEFAVEYPDGNLRRNNKKNKKFEDLFIDPTINKSPFDKIIRDIQSDTLRGWEIQDQDVDSIDYGLAMFSDRLIEGFQISLNLEMKNRIIGQYQNYCQSILGAMDDEFDIWRGVTIIDCDDDSAITNWKSANAFTSKWIVNND